ncbi:hypothetical protein [Rhizobium sp. BR 314]|uniref:hypothetical protein n=1 Tax=Rhizobium sp. BR 314 TaxID=3040013 RepID=UPI0039BF8A82
MDIDDRGLRDLEEAVACFFQNQMSAVVRMPAPIRSDTFGGGSGVFTPKGDIVAVWDTVKMEVQIVPINPQNCENSWRNPLHAEMSA